MQLEDQGKESAVERSQQDNFRDAREKRAGSVRKANGLVGVEFLACSGGAADPPPCLSCRNPVIYARTAGKGGSVMKSDLFEAGWEPETLCLVPLFFPTLSVCVCVCVCGFFQLLPSKRAEFTVGSVS